MAAPAHATFHLWKIDEVYSNASGTIQFIEFKQPNFEFDDERFLTEAGTVTDSALGNTFTFTTDLPSTPAANSDFLLATPGYAALAGVPAPDYILPTNNFFSTSGDTLTYAHGIDSITFSAAQLPTDGLNSLNRAYGASTFTTALNSPTNFAGQTGSIIPPANLTWNDASGNNLWDTSASSNWNNGAATTMFHVLDTVTFNDTNGVSAGRYAVTLNTTVTPGSVTLSNSAGNYSISGTGGIAGSGSLTKSGAATATLSTLNTYTGGTNVSAGLLVIAPTSPTSATASALAKGALTITGAGRVQLATNVTLGSQSSSTPASNVNITSLSIAGNATLDINNNHIIINYGAGADPIASIAALIKSGYAGGAWTGAGIMSTAAQTNGGSYGIGYADSADPGNPAGLASGQIEIKYTLLGDANLDGAVNGSDFAILATNFNKAVSGWDQGDFNYDGAANGADFALLASNFNKGASQAADLAAVQSFASGNGLIANVPEPASIGLFALGAASALSRRCRQRLH